MGGPQRHRRPEAMHSRLQGAREAVGSRVCRQGRAEDRPYIDHLQRLCDARGSEPACGLHDRRPGTGRGGRIRQGASARRAR